MSDKKLAVLKVLKDVLMPAAIWSLYLYFVIQSFWGLLATYSPWLNFWVELFIPDYRFAFRPTLFVVDTVINIVISLPVAYFILVAMGRFRWRYILIASLCGFVFTHWHTFLPAAGESGFWVMPSDYSGAVMILGILPLAVCLMRMLLRWCAR